MVSHLIKKLEDWNAEFRKQHDTVWELIEDEQEMIEHERSVYDKHDEKVTLLVLSRQELALEEEEAVST